MANAPKPTAPVVEDARRARSRDSREERPIDGDPTLDGAFAPDGVDLTLIRWALDCTPEQRLASAQSFIDVAAAVSRDED